MINNIKLLELYRSNKIEELKKALEANAREEKQKNSKTAKKDCTIINNLIKSNLKNNRYNATLSKLQTINVNGEKYNAVTDGYRIFISHENYGLDPAAENELLKIANMYDDCNSLCNHELYLNRDDIALFCKDFPEKTKTPYVLEVDPGRYIAFNSHYLLDALDFCQTNKLTFDLKSIKTCLKTPTIISNYDLKKHCLILPVNCQDPAAMIQKIKDWKKEYQIA